mgnify:CR=1 FL=1
MNEVMENILTRRSVRAFLEKEIPMEELEQIVKECVEETGASSMREMGKVMQAVMPKTKGRADGKMVNQIVKKYLA